MYNQIDQNVNENIIPYIIQHNIHIGCDMLDIPYIARTYPPFVLYNNANMSIVFVIETINDIGNKEYNLTIKYGVSEHESERNIFIKGIEPYYDYLIRRISQQTQILENGSHHINIIPNNHIAYMIIRSTQPIDVKYNINCMKGQNIKGDLIETRNDPEYKHICIDGYYIYILDAYDNVGNEELQPKGILHIDQMSNINIVTTSLTNIIISYISFDVSQVIKDERTKKAAYCKLLS